MSKPAPTVSVSTLAARRQLSPNIAALGWVSMLTAMSSSMIYGLLPIFLVRVLGASAASVGLIEGLAEAANSLVKVLSGALSDRTGRRKPLVVFGYILSAIVKTLFPLAGAASTVLIARVADRLGKGIRDAPRDAFLADLTAPGMRGTGFGLRLALAIAGFVVGPFIAISLMKVTGDDFRLVFWVALLPAYLSVVVLVIAVKEIPRNSDDARSAVICRGDLAALPSQFWWAILIAGLLSLARFSPAFLILKAHDIGVDAAFVPLIFVVIYLVYSLIAYPCGVLADHVPRRLQLAIGVAILIGADVVLASASSLWVTALGAAFWGLHLGMTQGLLGATVADAASDRLRGTAFGIYDVAIGVATFAASAGAGVLWTAAGSAAAFAVGACIAAIAGLLVLVRPLPARVLASTWPSTTT